MMTNLFSSFDPATSINVSMNWMSSIIIIMLIPLNYWKMMNRTNLIMNLIITKLYNEFYMLMGKNSKGMKLLMVSMFIMIVMNNMMGLLPYVFTSSSHLTMTLTLAMPMWLSLMMYGWVNKTNEMFSHLIPTGTPSILMPFMVMIETISNIIRPGALSVRLMANMIAGHLLMSLLGENSTSMNLMLPLIMIIQLGLFTFEIAVAIIQAYVFSILSTLYSSEIL
nr:ATPase subunit 6 [Henestaris halophilus]